MINTILIESQSRECNNLLEKLRKLCPFIDVKAIVNNAAELKKMVNGTILDLILINPETFSIDTLQETLNASSMATEYIFISNSNAHTIEAINHQAVGYLVKPIKDQLLVKIIEGVRHRIQEREDRRKNSILLQKLLKEKHSKELIGIPTRDGFEFIFAGDIIRCEGLQKCTRIVTITETDIISSYNIGEFRKLLEPYGFFSPHKSHLINLSYVRKYKREGTIILNDNSCIPVAKRRKTHFLERVTHL